MISEKKRKKNLLFLVLLAGLFCFAFSGTASAANVVKRAQEVTGGRWTQRTSGRKYRLSDGTYAKNTWLKIDGSVYYFDADGICETGWFTYGGKQYYASKKTGALYVKKWKNTKKNSYYLCANGVMAADGWHKIKGKYYCFSRKGRLIRDSLVTINGKTYGTDADGAQITDSFYDIGGNTYYFNSKGIRIQNKWKKIKKKYYYFDENGVLLKNQWIGDYYVGPTGARLTDCEIDGYYLDEDGKKTTKKETSVRIFVGDSRIVGMSEAVSDSNTYFIGKVAEGYSWLKNTASSSLNTYLAKYSNAKVVLALGVNDLYNISNYISYYKSLIAKYPKAYIYVMSVTPVNETTAKKYGYTVTNSQIKEFNAKLKEAFPANYLDVYTYMEKNGFSTSDGIHYTAATYKTIYNYVVSLIG